MFFFFSSRRRHTRFDCDWSSDVCSSDLGEPGVVRSPPLRFGEGGWGERFASRGWRAKPLPPGPPPRSGEGGERPRSEERRVGKECRSRWSRERAKKKQENEAERQERGDT